MADIGGGFWALRHAQFQPIWRDFPDYIAATKQPEWRDFLSSPWPAICHRQHWFQ